MQISFVTSLFLYSDSCKKLFWLTGSSAVDCSDSEQVLLALIQLLHGVLEVCGLKCGHLHPFVCAKSAGLNDVACQSAATIMFWLLPAKDDCALGDIDHLQLVWWQRHFTNQDDIRSLAGLAYTIDVLREHPEVVKHTLHQAINLVGCLIAL